MVVSVLGFTTALASALGLFRAVAAAPCDSSTPVLSDGTHQATGGWAALWVGLVAVSALGLALGVWSAASSFATEGSFASRRARALGIGVGVVAGVILWIAGAGFWASECPA